MGRPSFTFMTFISPAKLVILYNLYSNDDFIDRIHKTLIIFLYIRIHPHYEMSVCRSTAKKENNKFSAKMQF